MSRLSTYEVMDLPEPVSVALVLMAVSLSLAPWLGGHEIGPLKVPRFKSAISRRMRFLAPAVLMFLLLGYLRLWPSTRMNPELSQEEYIESFFSNSKSHVLKGSLFILSELEVRELTRLFGGTVWDGGPHWGKVTFDKIGRTATYDNQLGRATGQILLQGAPKGTVPVIYGEWHQKDGQRGRLILAIAVDDRSHSGNQLTVAWGPGFSIDQKWKKIDSRKINEGQSPAAER